MTKIKQKQIFFIFLLYSFLILITAFIYLTLSDAFLAAGSTPPACSVHDPSPVARSAIFEWFQKPAAIRFKDQQDRSYISWITHDGKIQIRFYDHTVGLFSEIHTIDDLEPKYGIEARDDHNAPSLLILPDGHILIFYAVHDANNAFFMKKSANPEDISSWSERVNITDKNTRTPYNYPQAKLLANGQIFLFYRRGNFYNSDEYFKISEDSGTTWSKPEKLIDFGSDGIYAFIYSIENQLHVAWNKSLSADPARKNVYYMYSPDAGQTWMKRDNTILTLPVNERSAEVVFNSSGTPAYVWDIVVNKNFDPFIVFAHKRDPDHEFLFARHSGSDWKISQITHSAKLYDSGNFYSGGIVIDQKDPYNVYLSKMRKRLEIERWTSFDNGNSWRKTESLTENSSVDNFRLQIIENYADDFRLVWSSGIYEGLIDGQWTGYDKVNIQSERTSRSIPKCMENPSVKK